MKRIIFIIAAMFLVLNIAFGFNISSTVFNQRIDTGGYKEFVLKNNHMEKVRYKISVSSTGKENDMSKWAKVYPKVISIDPLQEKTFKIFIQSPVDTKLGEYSMNLIIEPLVIPTIIKKEKKITGSSYLKIVPVIELFGYVGNPEFTKNIDFLNINILKKDIENLKFQCLVKNNGFAGIDLGVKLITKNNFYVGGGLLGKIEKNSKKHIDIEIKSQNNVKDIKKIIVYDAINLVDIKTIEL